MLTIVLCLGAAASAGQAAVEPTAANLPRGTDYFTLRTGLDNCRLAFERRGAGRVAFLGGSITHMHGWRESVCHDLQRRFPRTRFEFLDAGLPSTGSVPGAFRLLRDVFGHGQVDLLFEEAAVNDATNRPHRPDQWRRGMEGIVRHALTVNPELDIVLLYFADPAKAADYEAGRVPPVIRTHEEVAAHYHVNSLDLAKEVSDRINAGQFTWQDDFRDLHPAPFGQRLYAGAIRRLFDAAWRKPLPAGAKPKPRSPLPKPLDPFSYFQGRLVDLSAAHLGPGWTLDPDWAPSTSRARAGTRPGFVHVPMLVAEQPGAELTFSFTGTAAGIWIVAGPDVGVFEYHVDDGPVRERDPYTPWSGGLHLPWVLVLADDLPCGSHILTVRTTTRKNARSRGTACRIVQFCVNGPDA